MRSTTPATVDWSDLAVRDGGPTAEGDQSTGRSAGVGSPVPRSVAAALAAGGVLGQVAYPLTRGAARDLVTVTTVALFLAAVLLESRTARVASGVVGIAAGAYGVELLGVHTGWPFGHYRYTGGLGPAPGGVPLVVALSWAAMATAALRCARFTWSRRWSTLIAAAWTLVAWDLFLDPQMVAAGHWRWAAPHPGWYAVPLSNLAGWLAVATVLCAALLLAWGRERTGPAPTVSVVILLWTYVAEVIGNLFFFDRPLLAVVGAVVMGVTVGPIGRSLARHR
ncbi:MAG: carotenoid biosynthesis protein [Mycobacteriales bacterium]